MKHLSFHKRQLQCTGRRPSACKAEGRRPLKFDRLGWIKTEGFPGQLPSFPGAGCAQGTGPPALAFPGADARQSNRFVMLRRLTPNVERLCSMAEVAGGRTPAAPSPIRPPLKPMTKR